MLRADNTFTVAACPGTTLAELPSTQPASDQVRLVVLSVADRAGVNALAAYLGGADATRQHVRRARPRLTIWASLETCRADRLSTHSALPKVGVCPANHLAAGWAGIRAFSAGCLATYLASDRVAWANGLLTEPADLRAGRTDQDPTHGAAFQLAICYPFSTACAGHPTAIAESHSGNRRRMQVVVADQRAASLALCQVAPMMIHIRGAASAFRRAVGTKRPMAALARYHFILAEGSATV